MVCYDKKVASHGKFPYPRFIIHTKIIFVNGESDFVSRISCESTPMDMMVWSHMYVFMLYWTIDDC